MFDQHSFLLKAFPELLFSDQIFLPGNVAYLEQFEEAFPLLSIKYQRAMKDFSSSRREDFLKGRFLAELTLQNVGAFSGTTEEIIARGLKGEPLWPKGFTGSISHSQGHYYCACAPVTKSLKGIGVDVERVMSIDRAKKLASKIVHGSDTLMCHANEPFYTSFVTLVFSLKEAFFKGLYPSAQAYFGFEDARVENLVHRDDFQGGDSERGSSRVIREGKAQLRLVKKLPNISKTTFDLYYKQVNGFIYTLFFYA